MLVQKQAPASLVLLLQLCHRWAPRAKCHAGWEQPVFPPAVFRQWCFSARRRAELAIVSLFCHPHHVLLPSLPQSPLFRHSTLISSSGLSPCTWRSVVTPWFLYGRTAVSSWPYLTYSIHGLKDVCFPFSTYFPGGSIPLHFTISNTETVT